MTLVDCSLFSASTSLKCLIPRSYLCAEEIQQREKKKVTEASGTGERREGTYFVSTGRVILVKGLFK